MSNTLYTIVQFNVVYVYTTCIADCKQFYLRAYSAYEFVSIGYLSLYPPDMKVLPMRDLDYQPTYISQFHLHSINFYMNYEIAIGVGVLIHIYMFY